MRIIILGDTGDHAMAKQLYKSYRKKNYHVTLYSPKFFLNKYLLARNRYNPVMDGSITAGMKIQDYNKHVKKHSVNMNPLKFGKREGFKISEMMKYDYIKEKEADLIIVIQQNVTVVIDVDIPVMYIHIDLGKPPHIENPDMLVLCRVRLKDYYETYFSKMWLTCKCRFQVGPSINLDEVHPPVKKSITKPAWIARDGGFMEIIDSDELWESRFSIILQGIIKRTRNYIKWIRKQKQIRVIQYENKEREKKKQAGLSRKTYLKYLAKCRVVISLQNSGVYMARRILESMAHKALVLIHCESNAAQKHYDSIGLEHGVNCYFWRTSKELLQLCKDLQDKTLSIKPVVENAYEWVQNETYDRLAENLIVQWEEYGGDLVYDERQKKEAALEKQQFIQKIEEQKQQQMEEI
jgi:hypothetical protein